MGLTATEIGNCTVSAVGSNHRASGVKFRRNPMNEAQGNCSMAGLEIRSRGSDDSESLEFSRNPPANERRSKRQRTAAFVSAIRARYSVPWPHAALSRSCVSPHVGGYTLIISAVSSVDSHSKGSEVCANEDPPSPKAIRRAGLSFFAGALESACCDAPSCVALPSK